MNYQRKRVRLTISFIIGIIFLAILILLSLRRSKETPQQPAVPFVPEPTIPKIFQTKAKIQLSIGKEELKFPSEAPLLQIAATSPLDQEEIENVAKKLDFNDKPKVSEDIFDGTTFIWNSKSASLTIYSKSRTIEYLLRNIPKRVINKQLGNNDLIQIAEEALTKTSIVSTQDVEFSSFLYFKVQEGTDVRRETTKDKASFYQVNFSPKIAEFPVQTLNPQNASIHVWILPDGTVYKIFVTKITAIKKSDTLFKLKNFAQIENSLDKAIIMTVDDGNINPDDLTKNSIKTISINEIKLAYLIDSPKSQVIQPVFLLLGKTNITGRKNEVNISLYLPAIAN